MAGDWPALADRTARVERTSEANQDFPCQFNWRTLLVCALGHAQLGDEREARRLEESGRAGAVVAGPPELEPALLRLALLRGDEDEARRILRGPARRAAMRSASTPRRRGSMRCWRWASRERWRRRRRRSSPSPSYTRPFALRALGLTRGDAALVDEAAAGFEAMGLAWRAAETRALGAAGLRAR